MARENNEKRNQKGSSHSKNLFVVPENQGGIIALKSAYVAASWLKYGPAMKSASGMPIACVHRAKIPNPNKLIFQFPPTTTRRMHST
ncbi:MAG: hypothetical protein NC930_09610 [Candidatus Omnitrophica bacterium]|nr:hypothetical protein [Candidatus Omnitrophota bacterium]